MLVRRWCHGRSLPYLQADPPAPQLLRYLRRIIGSYGSWNYTPLITAVPPI